MIRAVILGIALASTATTAFAQTPSRQAQAAARFPGVMDLEIDATDVPRRIFSVRQTIPVAAAGPLTLRFPEWLPGNHAPRGQIEKLAGLTFRAGGRVLEWKRDRRDVYSFQVTVPEGARSVEARFRFLSATEPDQGRVVVTDAMMNLQWQSVSLYPAGWATRDIPVRASVIWPAGWQAATALKAEEVKSGTTRYEQVDYETLVDSPVFAGRYFAAVAMGHNVTLNIVADEAANLAAQPEQLAAHRSLVDQAVRLFGTRQWDRYAFLLALSDELGSIGLEHHRSSENGVNPEYFTGWAVGPGRRNLLPHELTHSWIGKHRRPQGQMVSDFATPLDNELLWVYEGQTQFWGYVLGARAGLFTKQDTLDALANIAATLDIRRARDWRSLDDTVLDPIITARRPKAWTSYQRSEDYYNEGMLIWLEADGIIRQKTGGAKGLDDFARAFFGGREGDWSARGFDKAEVVRTLNAVVPHDWQGFLDQRVSEKAPGAPLGGFALGGYRLAWSETPSLFIRDGDRRAKELSLYFSIGAAFKGGHVQQVVWDGPAFNAGLIVGMEVLAVNGVTWSDEAMIDAIHAAKGEREPIRLIVKSGKSVREMPLQWNGGHRFPRLERMDARDGSLDNLLSPR